MDSITHATFGELAKQLEARMHPTETTGRGPCFLLGIGGPGGVGKSTLTQWLHRQFPLSSILPLDDYRLPREDRQLRGLYGSHPDGNDLERLSRDLVDAHQGKTIHRPIFSTDVGRCVETERIDPVPLLLCDGEIAAHRSVAKNFDALVVVESHWRTQLNTRLTRDLRQRGYTLEKAIDIFLQSNLRDYPTHAVNASERADFVLYRNGKGQFRLR